MGEPSGDATGERCGRLRLDPLVASGIAVDAVVLRKGGGACGAARGGASETRRLIACIVSIELTRGARSLTASDDADAVACCRQRLRSCRHRPGGPPLPGATIISTGGLDRRTCHAGRSATSCGLHSNCSPSGEASDPRDVAERPPGVPATVFGGEQMARRWRPTRRSAEISPLQADRGRGDPFAPRLGMGCTSLGLHFIAADGEIGSDVDLGFMVGDGVELKLVLRGATKLNAMISRPAGSSIRELPARKGRRRLPSP